MKGKNAKGSQSKRSGYPQREDHQTHSRSLGRNPKSQKKVGANIQHPYRKEFSTQNFIPDKLIFINEEEIKSFVDKQLLRDFVTTRLALQELLKEAVNMESNNLYQPLQKHTKL